MSDHDEASADLTGANVDAAAGVRLSGDVSSGSELESARQTADLLERLVPLSTDEAEAAQLLHDLGQLLLHPLEDAARALFILRAAHQRHASVHTARAYRKAALRTDSTDDLLASLESEARLTTNASMKATLEVARGALLAGLGNAAAARLAYEAALAAQPSDLPALAALLELDQVEGQLAAAAERARAFAEGLNDEPVKSDLLALSARLAERAGNLDVARAMLVAAELHGPHSLATAFLGERLLPDSQPRALVALLEKQISDGIVPAAAGWLELAQLARYQLDDQELALRALSQALDAFASVEDPARAAVLAELAELRALEGQAAAAAPLEEQRVSLETDPFERAVMWSRLGALREELGDLPGAAKAYGAAVEASPSYLPALEGAGRSYGRLGDSDKLLAIHLAEAEQPSTPSDKATALRRAGELLVADPERAEVGIGYLTEASRIAPEHAGITHALERALRKRRDFAALCALYERELEHTAEPRRAAGLHLQIGALKAEHLNDTRGALVAYRAAAAIPGGAPDHALVTLARLLDESGELAELEAVLAELTSLTEDPTQIATLYERAATLREQRGDTDGAVTTYLGALANAPASHSIHAAAGRAFARAGRWDALISLYERATSDGSAVARASYGYKLGVVYARRLNRVDDGIAQLEKVRADFPDHAPSLVLLASLYTEQRRWAQLRPLLAALPKTPARQVRRALLAETLGQLDEALELWSDPQLASSVVAQRSTERLLARLGQWAPLADAYEKRADGPTAAASVARYRAAELRLERTSEPDRAAGLLRTSVAASPDSVPLKLALLRATPHADPARPALLEAIAEKVLDTSLRAAVQGQLVSDDTITDDARLAALQRLVTMTPRDPVASLALESMLEARHARSALVSLLRVTQRDGKMDDGVVAAASARLGLLLEELGSAREAIDAYELAASASHASLLALLALPRLYRAIGDGVRVRSALEALATAMPGAAERAAVLQRLATDQRLAGDKTGAAATLEWALREDPRAFDALRALDALVGATAPERIIDALMRALALEPPGLQRLDIGMALASRQLRAHRTDPARETLDRVLADDPRHLRAHLLLAEVEQKAESWARAATSLEAISTHETAPPEMRREALLKLARLQVEQLNDITAARATAKALAEQKDDLETLELRLAIARRAQAHDEIATVLDQLIKTSAFDEERRADAQLELAAVQEHELNDVASAIQTLGGIRLASRRRAAVDRLLDLGGKTGRWDLAASSLEATLDRGGDMEVGWEIAIRRRLASLLEGPLQRGDAAMRQYERIVALDPTDIATLERLAELSTSAPEKAIEYHRALLAADPGRLASYRALRTLFTARGEADGAFVVEAVLEALGVADEEETYFYNQRRAKLGGSLDGTLTDEERKLLAPETTQPAFALLHLLAPVLDKIFPVDHAAYGVEPGAAPYAGSMSPLGDRIAKLLGVPSHRIHTVPNRLGPCVEPPDLLFVPRSLEDGAPREQAAVLGELMARLRFDGVTGDARRATRMSTSLLEYLLWAACEAALPEAVSPYRGKAVYEDIKRRVIEATAGLSLASAARALVDASAIAAEPLFEAMERTAYRTALLCSQDPLLALTAWKTRFGVATSGVAALPAALRAVLPFVVSAGHLALRRRLQIGVSS